MDDELVCKDGSRIHFRLLESSDSSQLGLFFDSLSIETKSKYAPHPLRQQCAKVICNNLDHLQISRFVVTKENAIIGYFILDFTELTHEIERYATFEINLRAGIDPFFAPCISDSYQNLGISSLAMPKIIDYVKLRCCESLVLLGGTQETNTLGISFYKKWGFTPCGSYFSDINNIDMRLVL